MHLLILLTWLTSLQRGVKFYLQWCFEVISDTELTLEDFWKHHFNILHHLTHFNKAWQQVIYMTMNSTWRKLWPGSVAGRDLRGFDNEDSAIIDIVSLGTLGLEVNNEDMEKLLENYRMNSAWKKWNNYRNSCKRQLCWKCFQNKRKEGRMFLLLWSEKFLQNGWVAKFCGMLSAW